MLSKRAMAPSRGATNAELDPSLPGSVVPSAELVANGAGVRGAAALRADQGASLVGGYGGRSSPKR
jgi:hypothetical protein